MGRHGVKGLWISGCGSNTNDIKHDAKSNKKSQSQNRDSYVRAVQN